MAVGPGAIGGREIDPNELWEFVEDNNIEDRLKSQIESGQFERSDLGELFIPGRDKQGVQEVVAKYDGLPQLDFIKNFDNPRYSPTEPLSSYVRAISNTLPNVSVEDIAAVATDQPQDSGSSNADNGDNTMLDLNLKTVGIAAATVAALVIGGAR